jgi:hypothetical protein
VWHPWPEQAWNLLNVTYPLDGREADLFEVKKGAVHGKTMHKVLDGIRKRFYPISLICGSERG